MWFSLFAGSNQPKGCESGSGNTDVEGSGSLKDSTGWEARSDWPDWNLLEKKWKRNRSAKAPSDPVHRCAETFSKETRERKTVTENEMPFFSQRGTGARHSWHGRRLPNNPYCVCRE